MKTTHKILTLALLLISAFVAYGAQSQPQPKTWEYRVIVGKCWDEKKINALGSEGWELTTYSTWGTGMAPVDTCVFKRTKS